MPKYGIKKETQEKLTTKAATKSKQHKILTFFEKRPIEKVISRLTALEVFSFNTINLVSTAFLATLLFDV